MTKEKYINKLIKDIKEYVQLSDRDIEYIKVCLASAYSTGAVSALLKQKELLKKIK